jgi:predicted dehydrogenase
VADRVGEPLLVVGCGSIGQRHIANLLALGGGPVVACEPDAARRDAVARAHGVEGVASLEDGLERRPRAARICTPPATHVSLATTAAAAGCHLFIEKPISHQLDGVADLRRIVAEKALVALVACNMRFHPGVRRLKQWLDDGAAGRVLSVRAHFGHHLPSWRPAVDYREVYSAHRDAGGGVLLDAIHEIDYLGWFLGEMTEVTCLQGKVSDLEIDAEDTADLLLRARGGTLASVHLDYNQRLKRRGCEIAGTEGTLVWESRGKQPETCRIEKYVAAAGRWETSEETVDFDQPFLDEMSHFLRCLNGDEVPLQSLADAERALAVVDAARRSSAEGVTVRLS